MGGLRWSDEWVEEFICGWDPEEFLRVAGRHTRSLRRAARRLLCNTDVASLPIDITLVGNQAGLSVVPDTEVLNDHLPLAVGGLVHEGRYHETIVYNSLLPPQIQRSTIAHEIGDWYLGNEKKPLDVQLRHHLAPTWEPGQRIVLDEEVRADIFGLELLVPAPMFITELLRHGPDVPALAGIFDVTERMIKCKFWINDLDPSNLDPFEAARHFKDWMGPWSEMLHNRFYEGGPMLHNLPGLPEVGDLAELQRVLRDMKQVRAG